MAVARSDEVTQQELTELNEALEAAGIFVGLEVRDGALILSGEVDSAEMRQAAFDLAGVVAERHGLRVEDAIDVLEIEPDVVSTGETEDIGPATLEVPDSPADTITDVGTIDMGLAGEEAIPYFPPTDPVIGTEYDEDVPYGDREREPEMIGGFQPTATDDDDTVDRRHFADDERISDDVRKELREDASTTDLTINVETRNGVVILQGDVPSVEDSENAEAVAGRVAGVVEVRDELTIVGPAGGRR